MACEFKLTRQVEFSDTDMAGIMHFSNFFRFMEAAEHAFFRSLGFSIHAAGSEVGWPRVHADCDFKHPLRFEDIVEVCLFVREKREKTIVYTFIFRKLNEQPAREVARGTLAVACTKCDKPGGKMTGMPIPKAIADMIEVAPGELFNSCL
ncbi:MAG TPA: thioesterase family protein [Terriglobia bacterium]|nr:thioesterase family protein [Terriglobia bacterium]